MKAQSDHIPENFVRSNGKTQINYNITTREIIDGIRTRTIYEYDYIEIDGVVTKTKFHIKLDEEDEKKLTWIPQDEYNKRNIK